jgi:hypothetical protein
MTNRSIAVSSIALVAALLAGCASNPAANDAAASIPPTITTDTPTTGRSPLSGTWHGSASEVGSGAGYYSAGESLRINDDGTWILTERRGGGADVKYSGTLTVRGNTVVFSEANSRRSMSLTKSGSRLYGLVRLNSQGPVMFEFTRVEQ